MWVREMIRFTVFNARNRKHFMALIKGCRDDMAHGVWHLYLGAVTKILIKITWLILSLFDCIHDLGKPTLRFDFTAT